MFFFVFYSMILFAPNLDKLIYIPKSEPITYLDSNYDSLIEAVGWFEAHNIDSAYNPKEDAYGRLQIRRSSGRVEHFNLATGNNYTYEDMYDYKKAREVFLHYAEGKSYEQAAKDWNGSGIMTVVYWMNIKNILEGKDLPFIYCKSKKEAELYLASLTVNQNLITGTL